MLTFAPDRQVSYCSDAMRCVKGNAPTLQRLSIAYTEETPCKWLVAQLYNLADFCGCKGKLSQSQYIELSRMITASYGYLKVSEIMLFFFWFKQGKYGRFYGSVDPIIIMTSLRGFIRGRNRLIDEFESEEAAREWNEHKKRSITREEYERFKNNENNNKCEEA